MIDRKEIENKMKEYSRERGLEELWIHFQENKDGDNPYCVVYENGKFLGFEELESEKENSKYRLAVKIVDDKNLEEPSFYFIDAKYEFLTDAMEAFGNFDISKIWHNGYFNDKETYRTKSVEKSVLRISGEHPYKLIAFEAYGVREYEAKLH